MFYIVIHEILNLLASLDARRTKPRPQHLRSGSSVWHCSVGEKLCPIKLSGRALYDDGQMINSNVINHVTKESF